MKRLLVIAALAAAPMACATFDEVEGVPDSLDWSYFAGSPSAVADATRDVLTMGGYTIDAIGGEPGGRFLIRVTSSPPGASFRENLIEPTSVTGYRARAQTVPEGTRLPRDLEIAIGAELPVR